MDLQLFKTGLKMFLRPLVMILWSNKGLRKWAKKQGGATKKKNVTILAIFPLAKGKGGVTVWEKFVDFFKVLLQVLKCYSRYLDMSPGL